MKHSYGLLTALALSTLAVTANAQSFKETVEAGTKAFTEAYNSKNAKAMAEAYAEDAIAFPADAPQVSGRENIAKMWQGFMDAGFTDFTVTTKEAEEDSKFGYSSGVWTGKAKDKDGKPVDLTGKYVTIWKKDADGKLKLYRNIFNDDSPM